MRRTDIRSSGRGFSTIELLLAVAVFGFLAVALIGALVYGRAASAGGGDRMRAVLLADEGNEAVRSIRDANFSSLGAGTFGLKQVGGHWTLVGAPDTSGIYTRSIKLESRGPSRFVVTTTVNWQGGNGASDVRVVTELTEAGRAAP